MSKGTVLYIGGFELPDKDAAAHRVLNNAKILRDLGYKVVFVDVDRSSKNSLEISEKKDIKGFDCWSRKFPSSVSQWIKYLLSIKVFKEIIHKYDNIDAIICYNFQSGAFMKLKSYCKINNIKLIADCTEWYEDKRIIKKVDTILRMQYIQKRIDGVICISSYLQKYYNKYLDTIVIPPLVDVKEEKWKLGWCNKYEDRVNFIYSGRPGKHKDKINFVIELLNDLYRDYNFTFSIIGITKEQYLEYYPEHENIIAERENYIEFLGRVSHEKSIQYIKSSDFVIFVREDKRVNNAGFPTKFIESMTCGTPVITTRTSDLENYMVEGENGFFIDINDRKNAIAVLIKILEMNKEEIRNMKRNCIKLNNFNYENYSNQMKGYLNKIINF